MKYVSAVLVLFVLTLSVSAQQTATPTPTPMINGAYPVVSPSGKQIVFLSNRTGVDDLFVINADGSRDKQLTHTREYETAMGWTVERYQCSALPYCSSLFGNPCPRAHRETKYYNCRDDARL